MLLSRLNGRDRDEGVALILVLVAIMMAAALGVLALGVITAQVRPTLLERKNVRTINGAEAGLDAGLSQIRAAQFTPGSLDGDRTKLPCTTTTSPLTGTVASQPGNITYSVVIRYYSEDPAGQSEAWRASHALSCTPGSGPPVVPNFALLQSQGNGAAIPGTTGSVADRSLETIYDLRVTNVNIAGGLVRNYDDGNAGTNVLCWDAHTGSPGSGQKVYLENCVPGSAQQIFSYRQDLSLVLSATQTNTPYSGMCLTATPPSSGNGNVTFQPCDGSIQQKWSFNDVAQFNGGNSNGTLNNWCFNTLANSPGTQVVYSQVCGQAYNKYNTWKPEPKVGAGAAGAATQQLVNYLEFGRCFDITSQNVNSSFMIAFPCKQAPDPTNIAFNQRLRFDTAKGWLYTVSGGTNYCVQTGTSDGSYVVMRTCSTSNPAMRWTVNGDLGSYAASYTIIDSNGRCMDLGPPGSTAAPLNQWSTIVVNPCDGTAAQKWNAPPDLIDAATRDTRETTAGG